MKKIERKKKTTKKEGGIIEDQEQDLCWGPQEY